MALSIELVAPEWISEPVHDLCAHAGIVIRDGARVVVDDSAEQWAVGPAALMLLRTLDADHEIDPENPPLFPHCAHSFWVTDDGEYFSVGCMHQRDFAVRHREDRVELVFGDETLEVSERAWTNAVLDFAGAVRAFYDASEPKVPLEDDAAGWRAFWAEWERRVARARSEASGAPST